MWTHLQGGASGLEHGGLGADDVLMDVVFI